MYCLIDISSRDSVLLNIQPKASITESVSINNGNICERKK